MTNIMMASGLAGFLLAFQADLFVPVSGPADAAPAYSDIVAALGQDIRELEIGSTLRGNANAGTRLLVPEKCEKEGEAEAYNYALSGDVEEAFLFIPGLCLWIEIGYDKTRDRVRLDSDFISAVLNQYTSSMIYHVHPRGMESLEENLPSFADFITLALINATRMWNPDFDIKHRIVTRLGVAEYEFADREKAKSLLEYYRKTGLEDFEAQNLAYEYMRPQYRRSYSSEVERCKEYRGSIQQKLAGCSPIRTEAFIVTFRSLAPAHE
jgi:hypothetical protein